MQLQGKAIRVTIYIGESDHFQDKALYMALLQFLRREGAAGATVLRGLAGFGAKSRIHTASIVDLSTDLPIRVEWVDQPEVVERLLPQVRRMVNDGLITLEEVDVVQYAPGRRADPLAQLVQDVMRREVVSVGPDTAVAEVVALLLQKGYRSLPVVDANGRLQGIITDGDLLRRTELRTRLNLQTALPAAEWQQQLDHLRAAGGTAVSLMSSPVITIAPTATLRQSIAQMTTHDLKRLPVVDENGRLCGWISRVDILRSMAYHQPVAAEEAEVPNSGTTIAELMYRDVPTVTPQATLEQIVQALEQNRRRRAVVVDEAQRVVGIITDGDLLRRTAQESRMSLLGRLRNLISGPPQSAATPLADLPETAVTLMSTPVMTIAETESLWAALHLMMTHGVKRLPVVDENGRLVGLLGRASLLRGLMDG